MGKKHKHKLYSFRELENMVQNFDKARLNQLIQDIALGGPNEAATQDKITQLQTEIDNITANQTSYSDNISDLQEVVTNLVTKIDANDLAAAKEVSADVKAKLAAAVQANADSSVAPTVSGNVFLTGTPSSTVQPVNPAVSDHATPIAAPDAEPTEENTAPDYSSVDGSSSSGSGSSKKKNK